LGETESLKGLKNEFETSFLKVTLKNFWKVLLKVSSPSNREGFWKVLWKKNGVFIAIIFFCEWGKN